MTSLLRETTPGVSLLPSAKAAFRSGIPVRSEWHAIAIAGAFLKAFGLAWGRLEAVDGIGILGYRLWYETPPDELVCRGPRVLDVRPDGTVKHPPR